MKLEKAGQFLCSPGRWNLFRHPPFSDDDKLVFSLYILLQFNKCLLF